MQYAMQVLYTPEPPSGVAVEHVIACIERHIATCLPSQMGRRIRVDQQAITLFVSASLGRKTLVYALNFVFE